MPSNFKKNAPAKFYLSTMFGLRLMISSVAPTRLSTFYAYLITKIGNRNLKKTSNFSITWTWFVPHPPFTKTNM